MLKFINKLTGVFRKPTFRELQEKYNSIYIGQPQPKQNNKGLALGLSRHIEKVR